MILHHKKDQQTIIKGTIYWVVRMCARYCQALGVSRAFELIGNMSPIILVRWLNRKELSWFPQFHADNMWYSWDLGMWVFIVLLSHDAINCITSTFVVWDNVPCVCVCVCVPTCRLLHYEPLRIGAAPLTAHSSVMYLISTCFDDVDSMRHFPVFCSEISVNRNQDPSSLYHWGTSHKVCEQRKSHSSNVSVPLCSYFLSVREHSCSKIFEDFQSPPVYGVKIFPLHLLHETVYFF